MRCGVINTTIGDVMMIVASWTPASGHAICGGFLSSGPQREIRFGILLSWLSHPLSRYSIRHHYCAGSLVVRPYTPMQCIATYHV
jgi:hypothetical protein